MTFIDDLRELKRRLWQLADAPWPDTDAMRVEATNLASLVPDTNPLQAREKIITLRMEELKDAEQKCEEIEEKVKGLRRGHIIKDRDHAHYEAEWKKEITELARIIRDSHPKHPIADDETCYVCALLKPIESRS